MFFFSWKNNGRLSDKFYDDLNKNTDVKSITLSKVFTLAINTIAYMKYFSNCVIKGISKISFARSEDRSDNNVIFKISEKIYDSDDSKVSKIPHFRLLRSAYLLLKKGS